MNSSIVHPLSLAAGGPINHHALAIAATHLQAAKYFLIAAFTILVYEYLLTLAQEVERIWKQPWSGATLLFAANRYISLLQRPIVVAAFLSPAWSRNLASCESFVRFSGGSTVGIIAIGEIIMILRVWAIWHRNKRVLGVLAFLWVIQVTFSGIALGNSKRVPFPPFFVGCILTGKNTFWVPFWLTPLFTDSAIFALTVLRAFKYAKVGGSNSLVRLLVRDGALYFFCICGINVLNVILYLAATEDLKAIGASFSQVLTSVLVSRLVLNLRSMGGNENVRTPNTRSQAYGKRASTSQANLTRIDMIMGALGEESFDDGNQSLHISKEMPMAIMKKTETFIVINKRTDLEGASEQRF